jgi:hypothetical protein
MSENTFYYWHLLLTLNLKVVITSFSKIKLNVCRRGAIQVNSQIIAISLKHDDFILKMKLILHPWVTKPTTHLTLTCMAVLLF